MQRLQVTYEGRPSSVPQARHAVEQALEAWGLDDLGWIAALLVSELAANALLHARTGFTVVLEDLPHGAARLAVSDGSGALPRSRRYGEEATTGRGLHLIDDLARDWGVERTELGKTVWVELGPPLVPLPGSPDDEDGTAHDAGPDAVLGAFPDLDDGLVTARAA